MEVGLLDSGEGKEQTAAAGAKSHWLGKRISHRCCLEIQLAFAIFYAVVVFYVTKIYTHSWMEKLQMLPLCIVAVTAPMLWAIMIRKSH